MSNDSKFYSTALDAQRQRLLDHLIKHGSVSTIEARETLNIFHPAGRIKELRESSHVILTYWIVQNDHIGRPHRIGRYFYFGFAPKTRKRLNEVQL